MSESIHASDEGLSSSTGTKGLEFHLITGSHFIFPSHERAIAPSGNETLQPQGPDQGEAAMDKGLIDLRGFPVEGYGEHIAPGERSGTRPPHIPRDLSQRVNDVDTSTDWLLSDPSDRRFGGPRHSQDW